MRKPKQYEEIKGDLIVLAKQGKFDIIAHGCNCFSSQGAGIALHMAKAFRTDKMKVELDKRLKPEEKLGTVDCKMVSLIQRRGATMIVVNAYTQFHPGQDLRMEAMQRCFTTMNENFKAKEGEEMKTIGMPKIGCGIAGGDWNKVSKMIKDTFTDCKVIICKL